MELNDIWEDSINKLEDLEFNIDSLSVDVLPQFPLSSDKIVGPIILNVMNDITSLEKILSDEGQMEEELDVDTFMTFAYERGFLKYGKDEAFNRISAIDFIIDELQMNRIMFYRRSHARESIISPNKNIPAIKEKIATIVEKTGNSVSSNVEENIKSLYTYFEQMNPLLLQRSDYSSEAINKLATYSTMCESLYHDKKIMMIQRLDVTIQSLLWNQPVQYDTSLIEALRNEICITNTFTADAVFASRRSLLNRVFKVSTMAYKTKAKFRQYRIGYVPDRGGRVTTESIEHSRSSFKRNAGIKHSKEKEKKVNAPSEVVTQKPEKQPEFSEVDKVVQVFGANMSNDNKVTSSNKTQKRRICFAYKNGYCKYGDKCKYAHIK